ncbi:pyridoxal-phosphate dependent enzyme [Mesorhizobium sp.]|uniref:pyridoxal-phosphate dependent enzyme n=1 Tax=Mesorhizobium sp. TaxID=1871066 RepID=UPI00121F92F3|nr:pyridoxal-phosphate dependent enzyme [Mesorhizobium sp.]TIN08613.1 MAG: pyridoxal-phosphate dependent enzyme [Mesorhizobium sp.]
MDRRVYANIVEAHLRPNLVRLGDNLYGACFSLMKLIPARFMLEQARGQNKIDTGSSIVEMSSGTFGLALAIISALRDYRLFLVSDDAIDRALKLRIEDLGAQLITVDNRSAAGGLQQARLDVLMSKRAENPDWFWPSQYDNAHNPGAYAPFVELLAEVIGEVHCLVGTVGSGGSMTGSGRYLRNIFPSVRLIAVDTPNSILFGQQDGPRALRGLGNSMMPQNLDHTLFDEVHWVTAAEAYASTQMLHRSHALYMGETSGAAYMVASWYARQNPDHRTVVILPDEGHRYATAIYDDTALKTQNAWTAEVPKEPVSINYPRTRITSWAKLDWRRRSIAAVLHSL